MGKFSVKNRVEDLLLCRLQNNSSNINNECYVKVRIIKELRKKFKPKGETVNSKERFDGIKIEGLRFRRISSFKFITEKPICANKIDNISFKGIYDFLENLRSIHKQNYKIELMTIFDVKRYVKIDSSRIFLGTSEGRVVMLYNENGKIAHGFITESTIKKFRNNIFFHLMLLKK